MPNNSIQHEDQHVVTSVQSDIVKLGIQGKVGIGRRITSHQIVDITPVNHYTNQRHQTEINPELAIQRYRLCQRC